MGEFFPAKRGGNDDLRDEMIRLLEADKAETGGRGSFSFLLLKGRRRGWEVLTPPVKEKIKDRLSLDFDYCGRPDKDVQPVRYTACLDTAGIKVADK